MKIKVTQLDIARGCDNANCPHLCPIALALRREFRASSGQVSVGIHSFAVWGGDRYIAKGNIGLRAQAIVNGMMKSINGKVLPERPFTVTARVYGRPRG